MVTLIVLKTLEQASYHMLVLEVGELGVVKFPLTKTAKTAAYLVLSVTSVHFGDLVV